MARAAIALGSNIGDAKAHVLDAIAELSRLGPILASSSLYRTKPWGFVDQADFVNAALIIDVDCRPEDLLAATQKIEKKLGRETTFKWGPRVIDIDILTFEGQTRKEPDLQLPHPQMHARAFVLIPLAEIDPSYRPMLSRLPLCEREEVSLLAP